MTRDELKTILDQMYHISGVEETGDTNALLLAEFDRLTQTIEQCAEIAHDFGVRWYEEGRAYYSRGDAYGEFEHSYCRARGDTCMAISNAIMQKLYLCPNLGIGVVPEKDGEA